MAHDYAKIFDERARRLKILRDDGLSLALSEYYKSHPADFINDWGMTIDPRNSEIGLDVIMPFCLFDKQREFIDWLYARWTGREDGLVEKSRDMGVSWLCAAFGVWMWLFYPGSVIGFGSRKQEYVDQSGDPKSLFYKIRQFINMLPAEFVPKDYDERQHSPLMRVVNPANGAVIVGESGDNIGRGNRTSIYFKDESAFYEHADLIEAALSQTSNCKIDVSTPNGNGNVFYRKRHAGRVPVFTFHWHDDPRKDQAWYDNQKRLLDPSVLAQEVDLDYNASTEDNFIGGDVIVAAQSIGIAALESNGVWMVGVDAAHMGDDESVIHLRRGRQNMPQICFRQLDGVQLSQRVVVAIDEVRRTSCAKLGAIIIELDGPGVSCYDQLMQGKYRQQVVGVHTGARRSDDRNYNLKAKMWRDLRDYLNDGNVSLPNDPELKSQLASIKYTYKDGLLLMQDKKTYKKLFGKSPDRADALALTFASDPIEDVIPYRKRKSGTGWAA